MKGDYAHLNETDKVSFSIPEIAKTVFNLNYGQRRFLIELLKLREAHTEYMEYGDYRKYTQQLREMLENDWF